MEGTKEVMGDGMEEMVGMMGDGIKEITVGGYDMLERVGELATHRRVLL